MCAAPPWSVALCRSNPFNGRSRFQDVRRMFRCIDLVGFGLSVANMTLLLQGLVAAAEAWWV